MNKIINRTHTCGELSIKDLDKEVSLNGWISKRRDLGGLIFFDLRDRYGITQVVFDEKKNDHLLKTKLFRPEDKLFELLLNHSLNLSKMPIIKYQF